MPPSSHADNLTCRCDNKLADARSWRHSSGTLHDPPEALTICNAGLENR